MKSLVSSAVFLCQKNTRHVIISPTPCLLCLLHRTCEFPTLAVQHRWSAECVGDTQQRKRVPPIPRPLALCEWGCGSCAPRCSVGIRTMEPSLFKQPDPGTHMILQLLVHWLSTAAPRVPGTCKGAPPYPQPVTGPLLPTVYP